MKNIITEQFIKEKTQLTQNVDAADLAPYLDIAGEIYVKPILGYNFYNDLIEKHNLGTLNPDELELIEFIKYVVAFYAAYEAVPNLSFRISNKGIQSQFGEYSASEGLEVMDYIRRNIIKFAKIKEDELRAFLSENYKKFPMWKSNLNRDITKPDNRKKDNRGGISPI